MLKGQRIIEVEERNLGEVPSDREEEVVIGHVLVFKMDGGHQTIDWRNNSNGYYDGTASLTLVAPDKLRS